MATMIRTPLQTPGPLLARRLASYAPLSGEEVAAVERIADGLVRTTPAKRDLLREGDVPTGVLLVTGGWACRYKTLPDGRRQIVAFLLPGDLCDINNHLIGRMDHAIGALTPLSHLEIGHDALAELLDAHPGVHRALWRQLLAGLAVQREWTLNTGQRTAVERIGHLFCELLHRLRGMGLADGTGYAFPLTQNDLAEATGLTPVHVNRTLQQMRAEGLISLKDRMLHIPDLAALQDVALFTPDYLHLDGGGGSAASTTPSVRVGPRALV